MGKKVIPHGKGTLTLNNGAIVKGEFIGGKIDFSKDVEIINGGHSNDSDFNDLFCTKGKYDFQFLLYEQSDYGNNSVNSMCFKYTGKINNKYEFHDDSNNAQIFIIFLEDDKILYNLLYKGEFSNGEIYEGEFQAEKMLIGGELIANVKYDGEFNDYLFDGEGKLEYKSITNPNLYGFEIERKNLNYDVDKESYSSDLIKYKCKYGEVNINCYKEDEVNITFKPNDKLQNNDVFKYYEKVEYNGKIKDNYKLIDGRIKLTKNGHVKILEINEQKDRIGAIISSDKLLILDGVFNSELYNKENSKSEQRWEFGYIILDDMFCNDINWKRVAVEQGIPIVTCFTVITALMFLQGVLAGVAGTAAAVAVGGTVVEVAGDTIKDIVKDGTKGIGKNVIKSNTLKEIKNAFKVFKPLVLAQIEKINYEINHIITAREIYSKLCEEKSNGIEYILEDIMKNKREDITKIERQYEAISNIDEELNKYKGKEVNGKSLDVFSSQKEKLNQLIKRLNDIKESQEDEREYKNLLKQVKEKINEFYEDLLKFVNELEEAIKTIKVEK